jgi:cation:H+ antiporter
MPGPRPRDARSQVLVMAGVVAVAVPGLVIRLAHLDPPHVVAAICFGLSIVSAAFMLAWAAEVVQLDISAGLALALLALIAVLPEYAVDFVFTWKAGQSPAHLHEYGPLALANMTGGNQLLIGVGWSMVVLLALARAKSLRNRRLAARAAGLDDVDDATIAEAQHLEDVIGDEVVLERSHAVEISFLALATIYGLTLPLRDTLSLIDAAVLVSIFIAYIVRIARAPAEEPHLVGPAALIGSMRTGARRAVTGVLFVGAAGIIVLCAEHFANALVASGREFGIDEFLLVKWLAPLASEAPELLVAGMFAWRLNANSALGALVSSKVNQWTLLVGTLPIVYAISADTRHGLPLNSFQREELFVTAAQSAFGVAVLASRSMSRREAQALLGLFIVQFVLQGALHGHAEQVTRIIVGCVYLASALFIILRERKWLPALMRDGLTRSYADLKSEAVAA